MLGISNFIWVGDQPVRGVDFANGTDIRSALPYMTGQFAFDIDDPEGGHLLVRDPLGINKLFFAIGNDGAVDTSNYLIDLIRSGYSLKDIWSVPSGHNLRVNPVKESLELTNYSKLTFNDGANDEWSMDEYALRIRERMREAFCRLKQLLAGRPIFVTLSGGLDSTTIAVMAREYLGEFTAVTFSMDSGSGEAAASEDLRFARLVSKELGVPMETVLATPEEVESLLDIALLYGQDWRDFNVHCALVNAKIASYLQENIDASQHMKPVILTGDTMNELMADYSPVSYRNKEYYSLPRLPAGRLRRFLVSGLDSGDREVGVFGHYGLDVVQPYAIFANAYTSLPAGYVQSPGSKQLLVEKVMGDKIPAEIYARPKVRAQVGGSEEVGGTLAALADRGLDGECLRKRFCELLDCTSDDIRRLIRGGFYRFTSEYPMLNYKQI